MCASGSGGTVLLRVAARTAMYSTPLLSRMMYCMRFGPLSAAEANGCCCCAAEEDGCNGAAAAPPPPPLILLLTAVGGRGASGCFSLMVSFRTDRNTCTQQHRIDSGSRHGTAAAGGGGGGGGEGQA